MARKLKTYTTSAGFFDLAVAAPSMKAALEAWGSTRNLFHQGFATESQDPEIVAATMAKPGVVLRRPVGTDAAFREHAALPSDLTIGSGAGRKVIKRAKTKGPAAKPVDEKTARQAAQAFEREQTRRERQGRQEEAARRKEDERRERAIAAAQAALENAEQQHRTRLAEIDKARSVL